MRQHVGRRIGFVAAVIGVVSGCTVGPNYQRPSPPTVKTYTPGGLPEKKAAAASGKDMAVHFLSGQDIPAEWWKVFHSPALDQVIREALANSPSLTLAQARVREAEENYNASAGTLLYPGLDVNAGASRKKTTLAPAGTGGAKGTTFNLYDISADISYVLDVFGAGRRELESLRSQVDYERFQLEAAHLTLTANIVASVGKEVALRGQIDVMKKIIASQEKQLAMMEKQLAVGGLAQADVLAERTLLEQTKAKLPPLERELAFSRHQLTILVGRFPSEADALPKFTFDDLTLPQELPVSLPSDLVRQRPDIGAAEALLHVASADIGVATANMFPQITLSGSFGGEANTAKKVFEKNSNVWSLGADLAQPVLNGGELRAKRRAAIAVYDQAAANYRETVLTAFQNVADVLRALETDGTWIKSLMAAEETARASYEVAQKQYNVGAVSFMTLLNAEQQHEATQIGVIQALATRFADTTALFQVLGGGWWNRDVPKK